MSAVRSNTVVIGIGNPMRHDDGIGSLVIDALSRRQLTDVELVEIDGESTRLIAAWEGRSSAVVIDAVVAGDQPGTLHDFNLHDLPQLGSKVVGAASSHHAGLEEAIALGRVLDRLPNSLRILGIEPGDLSLGSGLSPAVDQALPELIERAIAAAGSTS